MDFCHFWNVTLVYIFERFLNQTCSISIFTEISSIIAHVHLKKTGGQTIRAILRKNFGINHCDFYKFRTEESSDWKWTARCHPRLKSLAGHAIYPHADLESSFPSVRYYCFLRKPAARFVSDYQFFLHCDNPWIPFADWASDHKDHQCSMISGEPNADKAIEILETKVGLTGMLERYNESLLLWKNWIGVPGFDTSYKRVNVAPNNQVRDEVLSDPRNLEIIKELNREDEKLYAHVVNEIYPRQVAEYGSSLQDDVAEFEASLADASNSNIHTTFGRIHRNVLYKPVMRLVNSTRKAA